MKIVDIEATNYRVSVDVPFSGRKNGNLMMVQVSTDEGIVGYGVPEGEHIRASSAVQSFICNDASKVLIGKDPLETEKRWHDLWRVFNVRNQSGVWSSGVSALDIALWDIKGKYLGQPIHHLLGWNVEEVPVYTTFGFHDYDKESLVKTATRLVNEGHDKLKMVVGWYERLNGEYTWTIGEDVERVQAVREAVGNEVKLMVDGNCRNSFSRAIELARKLEPYGITWFEEPLSINDVRLLPKFRAWTKIPVSAGAGNKWEYRELATSDSVDILQPNIGAVGGYTEALKVAHLAQAFNLQINSSGPQGMNLIASINNGYFVERHLVQWSTYSKLFEGIPEIKNGKIMVPQKPGLGYKPSKNISKYLLQ